MGRICRRESLSKVGDDFPSILVHRVRFRARSPPTDKHHKRRSTLNKFSQDEKAAGTGSWKRENGRETKWNLLKIGERRLEERKTPTWRDSNARSDSERDFHSPRGYSSSDGSAFERSLLGGGVHIRPDFKGKIVLLKNWK